MSAFKKCSNGHYYVGDVCPYCKTNYLNGRWREVYPIHNPGRMESSHREVVEDYIPRCPHCGKPVRKSIPCPNWPIVGSIEGGVYDKKVPWNYKWNGFCENCGHDYSISMTQMIDSPYNDRQTVLRTSDRRLQSKGRDGLVLFDAFIGLSGVEIEQYDDDGNFQKMFISTNELKFLINALKDSPLLEQSDWREDYT